MTGFTQNTVQNVTLEYVFVNGERRYDFIVKSIQLSAGVPAGTATITQPNVGAGSRRIQTNDLLVIYFGNYTGTEPAFRGRVLTPMSGLLGDIDYRALDLRALLDDVGCRFDYNVPDEFTRRVPPATAKLSAREIAKSIYDQFIDFHGNDTGLEFNLSSFPDIYPSEQLMLGTPLGACLQQLIDRSTGAGDAYRMGLVHHRSNSELICFRIGEGHGQNVNTGNDPYTVPTAQNLGVVNVSEAFKQTDETDVINDIMALGADKRIETAREISIAWDDSAVAPTNQTVLDNWNRYTEERFEDQDLNPDFDDSHKAVGRRFLIPEIADTWDEFGNGYDQGRTRRVKILPDLVQNNYLPQTGETIRKARPFVAYRYADDTPGAYRVKTSGFGLDNDQWVEFDSPLVRRNSFIPTDAKGTDGTPLSNGAAWNQYQSAGTDFAALGVNPATADWWLVLSSKKKAFPVTAVVTDTLTVTGYLEDAGDNWILYEDFNPVVDSGVGGTGGTNGEYTPGGAAMTPQAFRGYTLTVGDTFASGATLYTVYRIVDNDATKFYVNGRPNLTGKSATWSLFSNQLDTAEQPEEVWFNFAYESERPLKYESGKQGSANVHRQVTILRDEFLWNVQLDNFELSYSAATKTLSVIDHTGEGTPHEEDKDLAAITEWADDYIAPKQEARVLWDVVLPRMDLGYQLGALLRVNRISTGCNIMNITMDARQNITSMKAADR